MENGRVRNVKLCKPCEQVTKHSNYLGSKRGLLLLTVGKEEHSNEKSHKPISLGQLNSLNPTPFAFHLDPCFPADTVRCLRSVVELECYESELTGRTWPFCRGPCGVLFASENSSALLGTLRVNVSSVENGVT